MAAPGLAVPQSAARPTAPRRARARPSAILLAAAALVPVLVATATAPGGTPPIRSSNSAVAAPNNGVGDGVFVLSDSWPLPPAAPAPIDLDMAADGTVFVADGTRNAVFLYDRRGQFLRRWPPPPFDLPGYILVPKALAVDASRQIAHILWQRHEEESPATSPTALFLDERRLDGSQSRTPLAITFAQSATDMALHAPTGDLFVTSGGQVHHVRMPARVHIAAFTVGRTDGTYGRLTVTPDGRIALPRPDAQQVALYSLDGTALQPLAVQDHRPLAVAVDGDGNIQVLVRPPDPDDPGSMLVASFDASGARVRRLTAGGLGAAPPPAGAWPWAMAASADGMAFTTAGSRFEIHIADALGVPRAEVMGSVAQAAHTPRPEDPQPGAAFGLAPAPDDTLAVLDAAEGRLLEFDGDGQPTVVGAVPTDAVDLAVGEAGERYVSTAGGRLLRLAPGDVVTATWELDCGCELGGRLGAGPVALYVSRPRQQVVAALDTLDGVPVRNIHYGPGVGLWPSDVAVGAGGRLFTADLVTAQVQGWLGPAVPDVTWQAGLLAGPRRLASGRLGDGTDVIAAVMADGFVEIHAAADGNLMARWRAELLDGTAFDPADIALDAAGRVFLADARARAVRVFSPGAGVPGTPAPEPSITPTPSDRACKVQGDKRASAGTIVLGDTVTVTLSLAADCPASARVIGADIVLVIDRSGSMNGTKMDAAKGAARAFAELLDVRYHRLGLASFSTDAQIDVPLTDDPATVISQIRALTRDPDGQTNIAAALERAQADLRDSGRADALPVIVLLTDGQHNQATADPRLVAQNVRNWGAQIYTVGLGNDVDAGMLRDIAGGDDRYFFAPAASELFPIYGQILRLVLSSLAGNLIVDDELADGMAYVAGSARPEALVSPGRLRWGRSILPASGLTLAYGVRPQVVGCSPLNRQAVGDYTDGDGARRRYVFPVPTVCVVTPTVVPSATPRPTPAPIALPLLFRNHCRPGVVHADIVLLVDTSDSMRGPKLDQAKAAAETFLDNLDLPRDQAAVIGFDEGPTLAAGLTGDRQTLAAAVRGLVSGRGTHIDRALRAAAIELLGPRRIASHRPVVVLLSDGVHQGLPADVRRAAAEVRTLGAAIYAIGLGANADQVLLSDIAGPGRYHFAPTPDELAAIYAEIAVTIPCP